MVRTPGAPRGGRSAKRKQRRELVWRLAEHFWRILHLWSVQGYSSASSSSDRIYPSSASSSRPFQETQSTYSWRESAERLGIPFREKKPDVLIELGSDSEGENEDISRELPDISRVKRLSEVGEWIQESRFALPSDIQGGGTCLINRRAFTNLEEDFDISSAECFGIIAEALRPAVCFDLFRTLMFPENLADWSFPQVGLCRHRGKLQVIDRRVAELLQDLSFEGYKHCGITYIGAGGASDYIEALSQSCILSLIPVIFVVLNRDSKAAVASRLGAFCCFDDQPRVVENYKRAGLFAVEINKKTSLTDKSGVLDFIGRRWNEAAREASESSRYHGKVELRNSRQ